MKRRVSFNKYNHRNQKRSKYQHERQSSIITSLPNEVFHLIFAFLISWESLRDVSHCFKYAVEDPNAWNNELVCFENVQRSWKYNVQFPRISCYLDNSISKLIHGNLLHLYLTLEQKSDDGSFPVNLLVKVFNSCHSLQKLVLSCNSVIQLENSSHCGMNICGADYVQLYHQLHEELPIWNNLTSFNTHACDLNFNISVIIACRLKYVKDLNCNMRIFRVIPQNSMKYLCSFDCKDGTEELLPVLNNCSLERLKLSGTKSLLYNLTKTKTALSLTQLEYTITDVSETTESVGLMQKLQKLDIIGKLDEQLLSNLSSSICSSSIKTIAIHNIDNNIIRHQLTVKADPTNKLHYSLIPFNYYSSSLCLKFLQILLSDHQLAITSLICSASICITIEDAKIFNSLVFLRKLTLGQVGWKVTNILELLISTLPSITLIKLSTDWRNYELFPLTQNYKCNSKNIATETKLQEVTIQPKLEVCDTLNFIQRSPNITKLELTSRIDYFAFTKITSNLPKLKSLSCNLDMSIVPDEPQISYLKNLQWCSIHIFSTDTNNGISWNPTILKFTFNTSPCNLSHLWLYCVSMEKTLFNITRRIKRNIY
jgi:hypothetical protein